MATGTKVFELRYKSLVFVLKLLPLKPLSVFCILLVTADTVALMFDFTQEAQNPMMFHTDLNSAALCAMM